MDYNEERQYVYLNYLYELMGQDVERHEFFPEQYSSSHDEALIKGLVANRFINMVTEEGINKYKLHASGIALYQFLKDKKLKEKDLYEKQLQQFQSIIDTNISVRATNKIQKSSLIITGVAIVGTFIFQIAVWNISKDDYILHVEQNNRQERKEQADSLTLINLKEKTLSIQKQIDQIQKVKLSK